MASKKYILVATYDKQFVQQEWRGHKARGISKISVENLKKNISEFTSSIREILADIDKSISQYELDEIAIHASVEASGEVSLLGVGGAALGGTNGITLVFKKKADIYKPLPLKAKSKK